MGGGPGGTFISGATRASGLSARSAQRPESEICLIVSGCADTRKATTSNAKIRILSTVQLLQGMPRGCAIRLAIEQRLHDLTRLLDVTEPYVGAAQV